MKDNLHVILFSFCRLIIFTPMRMIYPFLPALARGMKVNLESISLVVSASMITSAIAPFMAPVAERRGRKTGMLLGLAFFILGALALAVRPTLWAFFLSLFLINLGDNVFTPAAQAFLGDRIPFDRRGASLAVLEIGWSLSFIICVPLAGLLIDRYGWQSPYVVLTLAGLLVTLLFLWWVPGDTRSAFAQGHLLSDLKRVLTYPPALAGLMVGVGIMAGNQVVSLVFGAWMEDSFGLQIAALGLASALIGFAELGGEGLSALLVDRLGKIHAVTTGLGANILLAGSLWLLPHSLWAVFAWLMLFYLSFEFAIVCTLPLMTEVLPQQRATTMATYLAAASVGIGIGAWLAPLFYTRGIWANGMVCVAFDLAALLVLSLVRLGKEAAYPA
jgi:predicted MFS family arabinose efflux permease